MKNRQSIRLFNDIFLYFLTCCILTYVCYTVIVLKMKQPLDLWLLIMVIQMGLANIGSILDLIQFIVWPNSDWVREQKEHGVNVRILWQNFGWTGFATLGGSLFGMLISLLMH